MEGLGCGGMRGCCIAISHLMSTTYHIATNIMDSHTSSVHKLFLTLGIAHIARVCLDREEFLDFGGGKIFFTPG